MVDYQLWLTWIWVMAGVPRNKIYGPDAAKIVSNELLNAKYSMKSNNFFHLMQEYFGNLTVRKAFQKILDIKTLSGSLGTVPNYKQIIKVADKALEKLSGPVKFDWL